MKLIEIFYLMLIFNVFMFIFGTITLGNGEKLNVGTPGDSGTTVFAFMITAFGIFMGGIVSIYYATSVLGNSRTPMAAVYTFGAVFQIIYMGCFVSFWNPLIAAVGGDQSVAGIVLTLFYALFAFLVESIFVMGFIQMTTGGWGLYK